MKHGLWIFVCGPSGAGKDSVIAAAAGLLRPTARVTVARRLVTRSPAGGSDEAVTAADFQRLLAAGELAWHWHAHGWHYGIERRYAAEVAAGQRVVVNGSREHASTLVDQEDVRVVLVTAPTDTLRSRLQSRGREGAAGIASRLARGAALSPAAADLVIENDGPVQGAARRLASYLEQRP